MDPTEILEAVLDWHQHALKIAQNPGDTLLANATLETVLTVIRKRPHGDSPVYRT